MRNTILTVDTPNANGRVYPRAAIEEALALITHPVPGIMGIGKEVVDVADIAMMCSDFRLDGDKLTAEMLILQTPAGNDLQMVANDVAYTPVGWGNVSEDGVVSDYRLNYIAAVPKEMAA